MENEQDKLIAEQIKTLPLELQRAIQSVPWKNLVQEIGKANSLNPDQMISFDQETMLIIYGFENPANYISNLVKEVGVLEDIANTLANSVAEKILNPINEKSVPAKSTIPEIAPEIHPVKTDGVRVNPSSDTVLVLNKEDAKQVLGSQPAQPKVSLPDYRYDGGNDPYREPLK